MANEIYAKLALIMADVANVPKNGYNSHGKYNYVREEDMVEAAKEAMLKHGVVRVPVKYDARGTAKEADVKVSSKWIDLESGSTHDVTIDGMDINGGNKAVWAAYTGCLKYELRHMCMIATGDDPEQKSGDPAPSNSSGSAPSGEGLPAEAVTAMRYMLANKDFVQQATTGPDEFDFVTKYLNKVHQYGADVRMSGAQLDWMSRIYHKVKALVENPPTQGEARRAEEPVAETSTSAAGSYEDPEDDLPF